MTEDQLDALLVAIDSCRIAAHAVACVVSFLAGVQLWRCVLQVWRRLV